ncbi:MAG: LolA family protein, partial [Rhodospirillales bacterium]
SARRTEPVNAKSWSATIRVATTWIKRPLKSVCLAALLLGTAVAVTGAKAPLDDGARQDLARIEAYFSKLTRLQARFLQVASTGEVAEGRVAIDRPGRMRIVYDPPVPVEIIADGLWLIYHDTELAQVSHLPLGQTPAGLLLDDVVSFDDPAITVTRFEKKANTIRVTLVRNADPLEGSLTLVLTDKPLQLRQWQVVDAQGVETTVSLTETRLNPPFDDRLFNFSNPLPTPQFRD